MAPGAGTGGHVIIVKRYWITMVLMMFFSSRLRFLLIFRWQGDLQGQEFVIDLAQHDRGVRGLAFSEMMLSSCCSLWPFSSMDLLVTTCSCGSRPALLIFQTFGQDRQIFAGVVAHNHNDRFLPGCVGVNVHVISLSAQLAQLWSVISAGREKLSLPSIRFTGWPVALLSADAP